MSNEICLSPDKLKSEFEKISQMLMQHYDKNIETQLQPDDENFLNEVADKLDILTNNAGIEFNREGFKTLVKKLYVYDFTQFGGVNGLVPYSNRRGPNKYDFFSIIALVVSIIMLYIAFIKFNDLAKTITGSGVGEISSSVRDQISDALAEIEDLDMEDTTFLDYVWNSFCLFGESIVKRQMDAFKNIIIEVIKTTTLNLEEKMKNACMAPSEIVETGKWFVGNFDVGNWFNKGTNALVTLSTAQESSTCVLRTTLQVTRQEINTLLNSLELLVTRIDIQTSQISKLIRYGTSIGVSAIGYLGYRVLEVLRIGGPQQQKINYGGVKSRKKRKSIKSRKRKKSRKIRKFRRGRK
jgi:hypothetical protein